MKEKGADKNFLLDKEGKKIPFFCGKNLLIFFIIIFFSIILIAIFTLKFSQSIENLSVCGDGTNYNLCSERKPYFCSDGVLIENADLCGCSENSTIENDNCMFKYQTDSKEIVLNYTLRGEKKQINFVAYGGLANYLSELPNPISYRGNEKPSRSDFKLRNINEAEQRNLLLPLVTEIQNIADNQDDQVRIAVSLVQEIPFGSSGKLTELSDFQTEDSRYPYEVLFDDEGVCGEKSELLAFLLKEMGYEIVIFYYKPENHEAVGIKCPIKYSVGETGYCFVETSGPSIITNSELSYSGGLKLSSVPEIILISRGYSLNEDLYEYKDAKEFAALEKKIEKNGGLNIFEQSKLEELREKYNLDGPYNL